MFAVLPLLTYGMIFSKGEPKSVPSSEPSKSPVWVVVLVPTAGMGHEGCSCG